MNHRVIASLRAIAFWSAVGLGVVTGLQAAEQKVYRIMPVGDSITEGGQTFSGYRYLLWEKLFAAGYLVEYVGSRTSDSRIGPLHHEGYSGKNAEYISGNLEKSFRANPADIVLIHAGHNHTNTEAPVHGIVAATESMIRTVRGINPKVVVLLAQVIPSGKLPKYDYIPELNRELGKLAARLDTPQQPVKIVNQAGGFNWRTDTIEDQVHPNARGAEKMAECWFEALTNVMVAPKQSFHPKIITYKQVGDVGLALHVFQTTNQAELKPRPAIVFFFGGGWEVGTPIQFYPECAHFAAKGFVAISADYRIASINGTTPFNSVSDGKSAIRWVRQHAVELGIDPNRIVAAGASAGGQMAAATALVSGLDESIENLKISSRPDALLLYYAVVDNGPNGYGPDVVKSQYQRFSPLHSIFTNPPPTLFFLGTKDSLVPVATAKEFQIRMQQAGGRCDLMLFSDGRHPLYSYQKGQSNLRYATLAAAEKFLADLGFE